MYPMLLTAMKTILPTTNSLCRIGNQTNIIKDHSTTTNLLDLLLVQARGLHSDGLEMRTRRQLGKISLDSQVAIAKRIMILWIICPKKSTVRMHQPLGRSPRYPTFSLDRKMHPEECYTTQRQIDLLNPQTNLRNPILPLQIRRSHKSVA